MNSALYKIRACGTIVAGDKMKKALVTGSSRGIGAATARALAKDGWHVTINYLHSRSEAEALASKLGTEAICADVADPAQVKAMFKAAGPFELLVCNAGIAWSGLLQDMTDAEWRRIFDVNVNGMFHCCREAIPHMVEEKRGCIICTSSILGVRGGSCETAYSATKGAVISFVKGLAKEPGAVDTDMLSCFTAEDKAAMAENSALCRIGQPEDIARVTAFLASGAASFITGQIVGADGGMII